MKRWKRPAAAVLSVLVVGVAVIVVLNLASAGGPTYTPTGTTNGSASASASAWPAIAKEMASKCGGKGTTALEECASVSVHACQSAPEHITQAAYEEERKLRSYGCVVAKEYNAAKSSERAQPKFTSDGGPPGTEGNDAVYAWTIPTCSQFKVHGRSWYMQAAKIFSTYDASRSKHVSQGTLQSAYVPALEQACATAQGAYAPGQEVVQSVESKYGIE